MTATKVLKELAPTIFRASTFILITSVTSHETAVFSHHHKNLTLIYTPGSTGHVRKYGMLQLTRKGQPFFKFWLFSYYTQALYCNVMTAKHLDISLNPTLNEL